MKSFHLVMGFLLAGFLSYGNEIAEHPFFVAVSGEWVGEGSLTNADGEETPIVENWKGAKNDEGGFSFEGNRQWGEENQEFRWVYLLNSATELYECEYWHTGMEEPIQFQVQLSDEEVVLTAPLGEGELKISNRLKDGKIVGEIRLQGPGNTVSLSGEVIHRKEP